MNYKKLYEQAKTDLVAERVKNGKLKNHLAKLSYKEPNKELVELQSEFEELNACFNKSEEIRKQQKRLITQMREQIDTLEREK